MRGCKTTIAGMAGPRTVASHDTGIGYGRAPGPDAEPLAAAEIWAYESCPPGGVWIPEPPTDENRQRLGIVRYVRAPE